MCILTSANCLGHDLLFLAKKVMGGKVIMTSGLNLRFEIWRRHPSVCSNNDCLCDIKLCFELTLIGSGKT